MELRLESAKHELATTVQLSEMALAARVAAGEDERRKQEARRALEEATRIEELVRFFCLFYGSGVCSGNDGMVRAKGGSMVGLGWVGWGVGWGRVGVCLKRSSLLFHSTVPLWCVFCFFIVFAIVCVGSSFVWRTASHVGGTEIYL